MKNLAKVKVSANCEQHVAQIGNLKTEDAYWRENYKHRTYFDLTTNYYGYAPAYRYGIEAYTIHQGRKFDEIEAYLAQGWDNPRGTSRLTWAHAKLATRDAYERLCNRNSV